MPNEIQQVSLPSDTAGRSAKLFYLLQQAFAKWDRGLEILRSVATRQGNAAAGYEVRELCLQYSVNSRMEAVYIRDEMLKLHTKTGSLRRPLEVVRFLEDEISKGEKLVRFPDLCLNAADKSAILLQAVSVQAREYLVLRGWQDRQLERDVCQSSFLRGAAPDGGASWWWRLKGDKGRGKEDAPKDKSKVVCWYCGKAGHYQEDCEKGKTKARAIMARQRVRSLTQKGKAVAETAKERTKARAKTAKERKTRECELWEKGKRIRKSQKASA